MYQIEVTPEALDDLRSLRKFDRRAVVEGVEDQLAHQPDSITRNRKRLRPNDLAEWELRVGLFRVFYDVDRREQRVRVVAVGVKRGNTLIIRGEEHPL